MKFNLPLIKVFLLCIPFSACSQSKDSVSLEKITASNSTWKNLGNGVDFMEIDGPRKSEINDSKVSILKIDPSKPDFYLLAATEHENTPRTASEWAEQFDLDIVINAGMYDLSKKLLSKGFLQNGNHRNNAALYPNYNAMIAFNPVDSNKTRFTVLDLKCSNWENVKSDYSCYAQGLRMIDCNGEALSWNKKQQSCSMLVTATDKKGNIYFIFARSPYTHNEMINFMRALPFGLTNAIYMEGGPQTSLYVNIGETKIEKIGSYVSETYPNDLNDHFWALPNVIGVKFK